jgi:hypothetical protein
VKIYNADKNAMNYFLSGKRHFEHIRGKIQIPLEQHCFDKTMAIINKYF